MHVTSDFECGNGKNIAEATPGHWRLDEVGEKAPYCKYFCVRADGGDAGGPLRLDVYPDPALGEEGRSGMLGHYPAPLWFCEGDLEHWVPVVHRWLRADAYGPDCVFTQVVVPPGGSLYVASNVVFPYSRLAAWAGRLAERGAIVDSLGKSFEGRDIPRIHVPATGARPLTAFVLAGQHPSEHCGPLAACGIAEFLLSAHPEARAVRREADVWLVPMINVDGNAHGRNGWTMQDINPCTDFAGASDGAEPKAIEDRLLWTWLANELRPDLYLEFHGYLGTRGFAEPPCDGCYVLERPDEVYASAGRAERYKALRDTLFWDTAGLTARSRPGILSPDMLPYHLARACGTLVPFYEINHAFCSVQGARRKGAGVFRSLMRTLLARE
jgi:hypothetical protein